MDTRHVDKSSVKHFTVCFLAAIISTEFSLGLAVGKEVGDKLNYGHWCWWDIVFDVLGAVLGTLLRLLILSLI